MGIKTGVQGTESRLFRLSIRFCPSTTPTSFNDWRVSRGRVLHIDMQTCQATMTAIILMTQSLVMARFEPWLRQHAAPADGADSLPVQDKLCCHSVQGRMACTMLRSRCKRLSELLDAGANRPPCSHQI